MYRKIRDIILFQRQEGYPKPLGPWGGDANCLLALPHLDLGYSGAWHCAKQQWGMGTHLERG